MKEIFKNKNFMLLWAGLSVSRFGERFLQLVIMWYVIQETGSALALGVTVVCITVPTLLIGPLAGVVADRVDKKKIIVAMDYSLGALILIIAILLLTGNMSLIVLYMLMILFAICMAFFNPAANASVPLLVEEEYLSRANSLNQFSGQLSNIIGPASAGILLALFNDQYGLLLIAAAIAYIISATTEIWIKVPSVKEETEGEKSNFKQDLKEGLQFLFEDRRLFMLVVAGGLIINFFLAPLSIFFTIMSDSIFNVGSAGLGIINSAIALGALIGSIFIMLNVLKDRYKTAIAGLVMEGIGLILIGSFMNFYATIIAVFLIGMGTCFAGVGLNTLYQTIIPKQKLGRVLSIVTVL